MNEVLGTLAYIGPETIVPLSSLLAVIGGVLLFAWQWICAICMKWGRVLLGKPQPTQGTQEVDPS